MPGWPRELAVAETVVAEIAVAAAWPFCGGEQMQVAMAPALVPSDTEHPGLPWFYTLWDMTLVQVSCSTAPVVVDSLEYRNQEQGWVRRHAKDGRSGQDDR